ncbi:MAG: hypothetical protein JSW39_24600, partial [Desulfobacterales bacterium]
MFRKRAILLPKQEQNQRVTNNRPANTSSFVILDFEDGWHSISAGIVLSESDGGCKASFLSVQFQDQFRCMKNVAVGLPMVFQRAKLLP